MEKIKLSVVIITRNEEKNIKDCLETLKWCDEVIVVDDKSEDKTSQIAKEMGAKVFTCLLNDDFAAQRNFGLKKARNKWVLFVDADERVTGVKSSFFRIIANPLGKFFQNYLGRLGFLDGMPGIIVALMMSFHSFLARAKLYMLYKK